MIFPGSTPGSPSPPLSWEALLHHVGVLAARFELARRQQVRKSLRHFFEDREPAHILGAWIDDLIHHIEWAVATPKARLMIFAPPRAGKSEVVSRLLPSFLLGLNPRHEVMAISSTQDLSDEFGLYVRNTLNDPRFQDLYPGAEIDPASNGVARITLKAKGGYRAVGVGGLIVVRGADWLVIDDPYKNREEAIKTKTQDDLYNWYTTSARNRLAPGGRIILMHQRFAKGDLADRLLELAAKDPKADQWRVVSYPSVCEDPATDPIGREEGEALFPERWPLEELEALRATMTDSDWLAMYQQRPVRASGGYFSAGDVQYYQTTNRPNNLRWYIGIDVAVSVKTHADRTAIVPIGMDPQGHLYIASDYVYERLSAHDMIERLLDLAVKYKPLYIAGEAGPINSAVAPFLSVRMRERRVFVSTKTINRTQAKHIMATPLQARMQHHTVFFPDDQRTRTTIIPTFLNFMPDADGEDDFIDGVVNCVQTLPTAVAPSKPTAPAPASQEEDEDAMWARILQNGRPPDTEGPRRLNGQPYAAAKA